VLLLGAIVYWMTTSALERQFNERIEAEASSLAAQYRSRGNDHLIALLQAREMDEPLGQFGYSLTTSDGRLIEGSLMVEPKLGWRDVVQELRPGESARRFRILTVTLDPSSQLSVAADLSSVEDVERAVLEAFGGALAATVLLGLGGGLFISSRFLRRVDGITSTAQAIIAGNLKRRIPVRGTSDDLDRLAVTLNRMLDQINELMEGVRQVSSDIAHDLRTPLSRLRQRLEASLAVPRGPDELREAIATAIGDTDDLLATFSALLRIAQIEAGTRRTGFADFDLSALVTDVVEAFAPSIQDEGKALRLSIEERLRLVGDRELLTQLVANLIENAIRHTPSGTLIEVALRSDSAAPRLVVADNGPGVPAHARDKLFDRFFRLERSRTTPGTGLGMSLVKAVATLHGARIEVSDNHPGLRLEVVFPEGRINGV
jgi:signal transduction histidine kinase